MISMTILKLIKFCGSGWGGGGGRGGPGRGALGQVGFHRKGGDREKQSLNLKPVPAKFSKSFFFFKVWRYVTEFGP